MRDVYFQTEPFAMLPLPQKGEPGQFLVFQGVQDKTIKECGWNGGWVRDCFGDQVKYFPAPPPYPAACTS